MFWIVVMIAGAILFFKIGDTEFDGNGWLFAAVSILLSLAGHIFLNWGMLGIALAQIGLFGLLTFYNMYAGPKGRM